MSNIKTLPPSNTGAPTGASSSSTAGDVRNKRYSIGTFGGKERFLVFDLNAFAMMEEIYGSIEEAQKIMEQNRMKDVRTIVWLGLIHDEAVLDNITGEPVSYNLTSYEVGSWLTAENMPFISEQLGASMSGSMPKTSEGEDENTPAAAALRAQAEEAAGNENPN